MKTKFYLYGLLMVLLFLTIALCEAALPAVTQPPRHWIDTYNISLIIITFLFYFWLIRMFVKKYQTGIDKNDSKILGAVWMLIPLILFAILDEADWYNRMWTDTLNIPKVKSFWLMIVAGFGPGLMLMNMLESLKYFEKRTHQT